MCVMQKLKLEGENESGQGYIERLRIEKKRGKVSETICTRPEEEKEGQLPDRS